MATVQSRLFGQDHIPTNYTGTHFKVIGIISNLQQSVRSESSLKIPLSHYLYKAAKAANNSLRLHTLAATARLSAATRVRPPLLGPIRNLNHQTLLTWLLGKKKKIWPWLTQGYLQFSNADPEIHLHRAMQKILRDKNDSWNTQAQLHGIQ